MDGEVGMLEGGNGWTREGKCPSPGHFIPVWLKKSPCDLLCHI